MAPLRPQVTVAYAQSLDGCLAAPTGRPLPFSGPEALGYTHHLRATHDAILVGIGTVLSDDPHLTVRHASGPHPQPIILDSTLRCPLTAAIFRHPTHHVWIATTLNAPADRRHALEAAEARLLDFPPDAAHHVPLLALLEHLGQLGIKRLMVEGGASVITAFLAARLADWVSVTFAPCFVGGVRAIANPLDVPLKNVTYRPLGNNLILEGTPSFK